MKKMKSENIFMVKNCFQSDVRTCKSMWEQGIYLMVFFGTDVVFEGFLEVS